MTIWATARSTSRCGTSPASGAASRSHACSAAFRTRLPTYASTYHGQVGAGRARLAAGLRRLRGGLPRAGLRRLQDPRLARRRCAQGGEEPDRRAAGGGRRLAADDRSRLRAPHLGRRAVCRAGLRRGAAISGTRIRIATPAVPSKGTSACASGCSTPLLVCEHVRGLEAKAAFMLAGGGDIIHADPEYDMGITGALKIAHFCAGARPRRAVPRLRAGAARGDGGDAQHAFLRDGADRPGHARTSCRRCTPAAIPTSPTRSAATAACRCRTAPGLGVTYDWAFIERNRTQHLVFGAGN